MTSDAQQSDRLYSRTFFVMLIVVVAWNVCQWITDESDFYARAWGTPLGGVVEIVPLDPPAPVKP